MSSGNEPHSQSITSSAGGPTNISPVKVSVHVVEKREDGSVYKVVTVWNDTDQTEVLRYFSDVQGLRHKLEQNYRREGYEVPRAPRKLTIERENAPAVELPLACSIELQKFLCRVIAHRQMRDDPDVKHFLKFKGNLVPTNVVKPYQYDGVDDRGIRVSQV